MSVLHKMHCVPCNAQARLNTEAVQSLLPQLHEGWEIEATEPPRLKHRFRFKNFRQTIAFVNQVAEIAHQENHHPSLQVDFNTCEVRFSTHSCRGLSQNDFICAAKVDRVLPMPDGTGEQAGTERARYGLVVYVPSDHLEPVKQAMFKAGAGRIGNYAYCSWQIPGQGQFRALSGSQPFLGAQGQLETVEEYRVEMVCKSDAVKSVIAALKAAHPYEQPAYWVLRLEDFCSESKTYRPHPATISHCRSQLTGNGFL